MDEMYDEREEVVFGGGMFFWTKQFLQWLMEVNMKQEEIICLMLKFFTVKIKIYQLVKIVSFDV